LSFISTSRPCTSSLFQAAWLLGVSVAMRRPGPPFLRSIAQRWGANRRQYAFTDVECRATAARPQFGSDCRRLPSPRHLSSRAFTASAHFKARHVMIPRRRPVGVISRVYRVALRRHSARAPHEASQQQAVITDRGFPRAPPVGRRAAQYPLPPTRHFTTAHAPLLSAKSYRRRRDDK